METRFALDYRNAEAAQSRRALSRALYRAHRWGSAAIVIPAVLYVAFAVHAWATLWPGTLTATVIIGAGLVLLIYVRVAAPILNRRRMARVSGLRDLEGRQVVYTFDDDGFRIETEHFDGFQKWAGVDRILVDQGTVLIVLGMNAHFVPGRLFTSAGQRREFVAWALQKLTPEARGRSRIE